MTSLTRWKVLCGVLVTMLSWSWLRGNPTSTAAAHGGMATRGALNRPIRVSPGALGISTDDLVRRLLAAKTVSEVRSLAQTLGTVGDDHAIDGVMSLVDDSRPGVPDAILEAFGVIATDHAVEILIAHTKDQRSDVRLAAVLALGERTRAARRRFSRSWRASATICSRPRSGASARSARTRRSRCSPRSRSQRSRRSRTTRSTRWHALSRRPRARRSRG